MGTRGRGSAGPGGVDARAEAAVRDGDEEAFARLAERYRHELRVHCYRMLGSFTDAEDLVQETLLRAWRKRRSFEGRATFRAWLYRIATNACLDALAGPARSREIAVAVDSTGAAKRSAPAEVTWLQPYPDALLDLAAPADGGPQAAAIARETIELAFLAAIQHLPPRQRAVLILRDVVGLPAAETAGMLDLSTAAVKSALQRARATLREQLPERRADWGREPPAPASPNARSSSGSSQPPRPPTSPHWPPCCARTSGRPCRPPTSCSTGVRPSSPCGARPWRATRRGATGTPYRSR
ncbi:hypothetical protein SRIMM317S_04023 [Streptomyces rimosus subsp. rimosus]